MDQLRPGAFFLFTTHHVGPIDQQITSFCRIVNGVCLEWFGAVAHKRGKAEEEWPNRRQMWRGEVKIGTENAEAPFDHGAICIKLDLIKSEKSSA